MDCRVQEERLVGVGSREFVEGSWDTEEGLVVEVMAVEALLEDQSHLRNERQLEEVLEYWG